MTLVVVAHGTRDPAGARTSTRLASRVARQVPVPVALAYADVRRPTVADVLGVVPGPVVVAPAFLTAGYHLRVDLPAQVARTGRHDVLLVPPPRTDALVRALVDRLVEAGWRPSDALVLAAAGSSDPVAVADVGRAAGLLATSVHRPVRIGYVATGAPSVAEAVARARSAGHRRVAVASWLLAPGLFHSRLAGCGADVISAPIGDHPLLAAQLAGACRHNCSEISLQQR